MAEVGSDPRVHGLEPTAGHAERRGGAFVVLLLVVIFHGPSLRHRFVYDDAWTILQNPFVRDLRNLPALLTAEPARDLVPDAGRPTLLATLMLDHALWAQEPWGYHLQNLLWHAATAVLLFLGLCRLASALTPALAGAGLFAVHPLLVEPVAAVNYREDLLAAFFMLAAMCLVVAARRSSGWAGRAGLRALAFVSLVVSIGAKENAMIAPIALAMVDVCRASDRPAVTLRRGLRDYLLLAVAAALVFCWRWAVLGDPAIVSRTAEIPAAHRDHLRTFLAGAWVLLRGLGQMVLPFGLSPEYDEDPTRTATVILGAAALAVLIGGILLAYRRRARAPLVAAGIVAGVSAYLPTSGLVAITNLRADRYFYLPALFLLPALATLGLGALSRIRWFTGPSIFALPRSWLMVGFVFLLYGAASHRQGRVWRDDLTLWTVATERAPGSARAWSALGEAHLRANSTIEALADVERSLALRPESGHTHELRAIIAMQQGDHAAAEREFRLAGKLGVSDRAELANNLGFCLLDARRPREALVELERAARLGPRYDRPLLNAARAHEMLGDEPAALDDLRRLTERVPESIDGWTRLGALLEKRGDRAGALAAYRRSFDLLPTDEAVRRTIARLAR